VGGRFVAAAMSAFCQSRDLFAALGPPLGWLTLLSATILLWQADPGTQNSAHDALGSFVLAAVVGMALSYVIGYGPAILAGVIIAFVEAVYPAAKIYAAAIVGLTIGFVFASLFDQRSLPGDSR
jgi:hypothetical protein